MFKQYAQLAAAVYRQVLIGLGFVAVAFLSGVGAGALMLL